MTSPLFSLYSYARSGNANHDLGRGRTAGGSCVRAACLSGHRQCGQARRRHGRVRGWQASVRARARRNLWADGRVCVADAAEDTV